MKWTAPADIEAKLRRQWRSGEILQAWAGRAPFPAVEVPLRGPSASELADHLDDARRWAASIERASRQGRCFTIESKTVGGRHFGRTELPGRAVIADYSQAWEMLGTRADVAAFDEILALSAPVPVAHKWVLTHPLKAIGLASEWTAILAARDWLDWNRGSGLFLRQIDAPGADTKLIERHRGVLAELLGVTGAASGFTQALGYSVKPSFVRIRFDPALLGMPAAITEAEFRLDELLELGAGEPGLGDRIEHALIVENEISYLSVPVPAGGVVVWGRGYDAGIPSSLDWLQQADARGMVRYWGDIDTHGFAILNRVRARLPNARSMLMNRETLLAHRERWGTEPAPTTAALNRLTDAESSLYADLVTDRYAPGLRLEQERIDWAWVERRLARII
jgi:hypothetical protein